MLRLSSLADRGIGPLWREGERRAVAPAADDLRRQQLLAARIELGGYGQLPAERGDVLVELAVDEKGAVRAQLRRRRRRRKHALLVAVTEDELSGADRPPASALGDGSLAGERSHTAALDRRLSKTVGITEVLDATRQRGAELVVEDGEPAASLDARTQSPSCASSASATHRADHHEHVDRGRSRRPPSHFSGALSPKSPEQLRPRRHPLAKLLRESRQARVGHPERAQPRVAEGDVDARLRLLRPGRRRQHVLGDLGDPGRGSRDVVDPQEQVAGKRQAIAAHDEALDPRQVEDSVIGRRPPETPPAARRGRHPLRPQGEVDHRRRVARLRLTSSTVRSP